MNGQTYLNIALVCAGIGIVLKIIQPLANRWHKKLKSDLERMKKGGHGHS